MSQMNRLIPIQEDVVRVIQQMELKQHPEALKVSVKNVRISIFRKNVIANVRVKGENGDLYLRNRKYDLWNICSVFDSLKRQEHTEGRVI